MIVNKSTVVIDDLTGGINQKDPPHAIGDNQAVDLRNVEFVSTRFMRKRNGSKKTITGTIPFAAGKAVVSLIRHTSDANESSAQLWGVSNDTTPVVARINGTSTWATITPSDTVDANEPDEVYGASLNGKLFLAYKSAVARLHVYDGNALRRVGVATPAAPTVANTGAGSYAAVKRWYKVQWINTSVTPFIFSELSPEVTFTPSGTGLAARITRPTLPGDGETQWRLYGSSDGVNYYVLQGALVATTFFDDASAPATYSALLPTLNGFPTAAGYFTAPGSVKYLIADESRLLMAGDWNNVLTGSRLWWTPVSGTSGFTIADDERLPPENFLDLNPLEGGDIVGFGGPIDGYVYVFKQSHIYKLVRTGQLDKPYLAIPITKIIGGIHQRTILVGEDESGAACIYFAARRGPYRLGRYGLEYLGRDIEPIWATLYMASSSPPHGVYYRDQGQVWWWIATGVSNTPTLKLKFTVEYGQRDAHGRVRGGWTIDDGASATCVASVMCAETLGNPMALKLRPYAALTAGSGEVYMHDAPTIFRDNNDTATYAGSGIGKAYPFAGMGRFCGIDRVYLQGTPITSLFFQVGLTRDFGAEVKLVSNVLLTPEGSATRVETPVEELQFAQCRYVQPTLGDVAPGNIGWTLDSLTLRVRAEDVQ